MGTLADAFCKEDRVTLPVSNLIGIMRSDALNWAQNHCLINGVKGRLPYDHILTMIDEKCTEESNTIENKEEN